LIALFVSLVLLPVRLLVTVLYLFVALPSAMGHADDSGPHSGPHLPNGDASRSRHAGNVPAPWASAATPTAPSRHLWWALSPAYTFGAVAFIPALHAAIRLRQLRLWYAASGLLAGNVVAWALLSSPNDGAASTVGSFLLIFLAVVGTVQALPLRRAVFGERDAARAMAAAAAAAGRDPAVAQALAARRRRSDSAALAARDPALARDLMIGRPDLARQYYDGGLVDVNHVPASVLVAHLGLNAEQADEIIRARDDIGHFESADELVHLTSVSTAAIDAVRDRIILL
jgi:hypothetical protein